MRSSGSELKMAWNSVLTLVYNKLHQSFSQGVTQTDKPLVIPFMHKHLMWSLRRQIFFTVKTSLLESNSGSVWSSLPKEVIPVQVFALDQIEYSIIHNKTSNFVKMFTNHNLHIVLLIINLVSFNFPNLPTFLII
jgi:hypothetical protein